MTWEEALGLLDKAADVYIKVTQPTTYYQPPVIMPTTTPTPTPTPTPTRETTDWVAILKELTQEEAPTVPEISEERKPQIPWWIIGSIGVAIAVILVIALVK